MENRRRRRFAWPRAIWTALVATDAVAGWWLYKHDHLDLMAMLVVACMFIASFVTGAALILARLVTRPHERAPEVDRPRLEAAADNVFPIRPELVAEETMVLPLVAVGRAEPVIRPAASAGAAPGRPVRQLSYTSGDHTIDCYIDDVLREGDTG